jgi:hypothetical protein
MEVDYIAGGIHLIDNNWVRKNLSQPLYTITDLEGPNIIPEDWSFCEAVKKKGGKIMIEPTIPNLHWGLYGWESITT